MLDYFMPFIMTVLAAIGGWAVQILSKSTESENTLKELQISAEDKKALKTLGWDCWFKIEEDFKFGDKVKTKLATFEYMIRNRYPNISAQEMDLLNKSIAGEFNKDKVKVIDAVSRNISSDVPSSSLSTSDNTLEMPPVVVPVVPEVVEPITVTVTPTYKYQAPDGTPLMAVPAAV